MAENENTIGNIVPVESADALGIKSLNSPFAQSFYFNDVYDEKAVKSFIKKIERLVRGSREYKNYIELLRTNVNILNHDNILSNITNADCPMEFHHYPLSLYDIIEIIITHHIMKDIKFTSFSIAKEVMEEHFKHHIGLVPFIETTHELAHSGNLFISKKQIFGNYQAFINDYKEGIKTDLINKINQMEQLSSANVNSDYGGLLK